MLIRTFSKCSLDVKFQLFNSFCVNMYCIHLWSDFHSTVYKKFQIVYNNGLRKLLGLSKYCSASGMFAYCKIDSLQEIVRKSVYKFIQRLCNSKNLIIKKLASPRHMLLSQQWHSWYNCLHCCEMKY